MQYTMIVRLLSGLLIEQFKECLPAIVTLLLVACLNSFQINLSYSQKENEVSQ